MRQTLEAHALGRAPTKTHRYRYTHTTRHAYLHKRTGRWSAVLRVHPCMWHESPLLLLPLLLDEGCASPEVLHPLSKARERKIIRGAF